MSRTQEEILASITTEAGKYTELNDLEANTSKVAFWKYIKQTMAFASWWLEQMFDQHKMEIQTIVDTTEIGTSAWYHTKALAYQNGDILTYSNNVLGYSDTTSDQAKAKQIVQKASVSEKRDATQPTGVLIFKLLKASNGILTGEEKQGFASYMDKVKIMGTGVEVISGDAIPVKFTMTIELDAQVFNSDGTRKSDGLKVVEITMTDYLASVPFDGVFFISKLEDTLQSVVGVVDIAISEAKKKEAGSWSDIVRKFNPYTGWMATTFTGADSTTITYVTS